MPSGICPFRCSRRSTCPTCTKAALPPHEHDHRTAGRCALFNNDFVVDCGNTLAGRILREDPSDDWRSHIARADRTTFGRTPADDEITDALSFLRVQAARIPPEHEHLADDGATASPDEKSLRTAFADLCHTLLNANEFLFVE